MHWTQDNKGAWYAMQGGAMLTVTPDHVDQPARMWRWSVRRVDRIVAQGTARTAGDAMNAAQRAVRNAARRTH